MSDPIPVLLQAGFSSSSTWNSSDGYTSVNVGSVSGNAPSVYGHGNPLNYVMIFDRKTPNAGPVFQANAPDSRTVPPGLDAYLTTDYIMFWASAAFVNAMPQGALYTMLKTHGGSTQLERMETLSTKFACGINGSMVYLLVTVPDASLQGFEMLEQRAVSATGGTDPVYSYKTGPYQMLLNLVQDSLGQYTPVNPY